MVNGMMMNHNVSVSICVGIYITINAEGLRVRTRPRSCCVL